jgi:diguanylate cyclase (GGDEF)-like protein
VVSHSFRMIQNSWRLIAICALIAWTVSLFISFGTTPEYHTSATFLIFPNANLTSSRDVVTSLDTLDKRTVIFTYADIMGSNRVLAETAQKLKIDPIILSRYDARVEVQVNTNILALIIEGPDPDLAVTLANNMGQTGINYIKGIYQVFDITFLDKALKPLQPFMPTPLRTGGIWAAFGLLAGVVIAVLKESIRVPLEALRERAITDKVSGAFNQRYFRRCLERELVRSPTEPVTLALLELEGFQELVEGLPEHILTDLLHKVTAILRNQLRGNDLVGRWGRTSFALLLPSTPSSAATRTLERIRQALEEPLEIDSTSDKVNPMPIAGLSTRNNNETCEKLIEQAEAARDSARQTGRVEFQNEQK